MANYRIISLIAAITAFNQTFLPDNVAVPGSFVAVK